MSWTHNVAESDPTPVTLSRVEAIFRKNNVECEVDEGGLSTWIQGYFSFFQLLGEKNLVFSVRRENSELDISKLPIVKEWANIRNSRGTVGTCAYEVADGTIRFTVAHAIPVIFGATDQQLEEWILTGTALLVEHLETLNEMLGLAEAGWIRP
ncbi:hypothetical protein CMUST_03365 [Corynebacterium mustelae]|uniref:Bacterial sensory transduction regulator n=1 Tax=Corynebacterium mustelae TaxID=571915 RepID=A0A0G3H1M4_9CORY|nr:hypothetical protein [Corynebacterium mustelae]AKK05017.1 hypothetical protein CMUST_03365 [Corynebacterium mustelae]